VDIQAHLSPSEKILSEFKPFYATSHRIIRVAPGDAGSRTRLLEIPYHQLTAVELMRRPNHPMMIIGTIMTAIGLYLATVPFITSIFAILAGAAVLAIGARGKLGYYQLHASGMPPEAERFWQVDYQRSGSFIATVRSAIGQLPDF
jgi:hypothetical protein